MREDIQLYNQALDHAKQGQWQESETLLLQAIQLNSQEAEYYSLLAVSLLGLGLISRAIAYLRMAYKLNPSDPLLQHHILLLILGGSDTPLHFDIPPNTDSYVPTRPKPFTPSFGAEALPDQGISDIP
uniref:Tetratricopeptide repeat protein n=1 Tax=Oscillatoriales cyanobacterium SpSt-402 TaxID=2282168 RepID=A0A832M3G3_9CYAN